METEKHQIARLIHALAFALVDDYLREQASNHEASNDSRPDHATLRDMDQAA